MQAWMHPKEKELITKHFSPQKTMLEWGSGGSTVEFSPQLKEYYSIEHNLEWYNKVKEEIESLSYSNVNYNYVPQNKDNYWEVIKFSKQTEEPIELIRSAVSQWLANNFLTTKVEFSGYIPDGAPVTCNIMRVMSDTQSFVKFYN